METIQDSIALKPLGLTVVGMSRFGTIQNSIALKLIPNIAIARNSFGTIQNSIALKPRRLFLSKKFRNRTICLS
ncbi:TPA: hypothetical protein VES08_001586 [Streptococcus pyogenes]|nr:hypothetical protein [Streptococcus pyogenes]